MAAATDPEEVLRSTSGKGNFQRVARLLISGGTTLLREIFDQICPPSNLPTILKNPATVKQLKAAKLTKLQWDCLYPSPGVYGKSSDFEIILLFRLLRTISNLTPPATGWYALPASTDHSLAANLVRIKYYRNTVYGHVNQKMEITADEFPQLWQEISDALIGIAGQISPVKKLEWQKAIDNFLTDSLTTEDERNVQEGIERLERSVQGGLEGIRHVLETAVREEAQNIKQQLGELHQSMDRLGSSAGGPRAAGARLRLPIDCEAITAPGPIAVGGSSELVAASQEHQTEIQLQAKATESAVLAASNHGTLPSLQEVSNLAASKYLNTIDPSKPEEYNGFVDYLRDLAIEGNDEDEENSVSLPDEVVDSLLSREAGEVVVQLKECLELDQTCLEQPGAGTEGLIRCLVRKAKRADRLDVVKHLREITPAGTTGPLLEERLDVRQIPIRQRWGLTIALSGGDEWKEVAEELGLTPAEIRFLDNRILNPFDAALGFIANQRYLSVGRLYDVLNKWL